jgi:hypothetical protein
VAAGPAAAAERPNGHAVQFGIAGSFRLADFGDPTLAYQRFIGPDLAWRTSLGVDLRYDDSGYSVEYEGPEPSHGSKDVQEWTHTVGIASEWLWYRGAAVSLFFGGGPRVSYAGYQYDNMHFNTYHHQWTGYRDQISEWAAGAQACLGVQWVAVEWLTVHAEYDARAMYRHRVLEQEWIYAGDEPTRLTEKTTTDGLLIDSLGVRFGLSVYF